MELELTLNEKYKFDTIYFNKSLIEWIHLLDTCTNKYEYDRYAHIISNIMICINEEPNDIYLYIRGKLDLDPYMKIIHGGYIENYLYYKNESKKISKYKKMYKTIVTNINNDICLTYWYYLPDEIKTKYLDIINKIFEHVSELVLSAGMSTLNIDQST
jgi:hypothetical protein